MQQRSLVHEVLGITDPTNRQASIEQAFETLACKPADEYSESDQSDLELNDAMAFTVEILDHTLNEAHTLTNWFAYTTMMQRYGKRHQGQATALMIGAANPLSSRAFVCLAQKEYGADRAIIIDLVGSTYKNRHGTFVRGDGLALPFRSGSMDFVHTNQLFHALENTAAPEAPRASNIEQLLSEIARVLAPHGQVLMHEYTPGMTRDNTREEMLDAAADLKRLVTGALARHGITKVHANLGLAHNNADFLFDPTQNFNEPEYQNPTKLDIYARKPSRWQTMGRTALQALLKR